MNLLWIGPIYLLLATLLAWWVSRPSAPGHRNGFWKNYRIALKWYAISFCIVLALGLILR